jgi:hypothetical protein
MRFQAAKLRPPLFQPAVRASTHYFFYPESLIISAKASAWLKAFENFSPEICLEFFRRAFAKGPHRHH